MKTTKMDTSWMTCACAVVMSLVLMVVEADDPVLDTTKGKVTGSVAEGVKKFVGIPFAKPPVGDLRFKHPVEPDPWSGVKEAKTLPNSCWQTIDTNFDQFHGADMWNPNTPMSEDCLYLNVWIPNTATANKPIVVWIYGGGFWAGTSTLDVYNPVKLVAMSDIIVVSLNYRLGTLGFLYSGSSAAPGNAGMMDQVMAMKWVKDNAANMGGNPNKITIMGESAGATSVGYHLLSELSKPLFNYAVMMSASPYASWGIQPHDVAISSFRRLADKLNCGAGSPDDMVQCMRDDINASVLTAELWGLVDGTYIDTVFSPIVGDGFLPHSVNDLMKQVKDTSIMTGVVKDEGIFWLVYGFQEVFERKDPNTLSEDQYNVVLNGIMKDQGAENYSAVKDFTSFIYRDMYGPKHRPDRLDALDDMSGDTLFKCAVRNFASDYSSTTSSDSTYVYSFNYRLSNNPWPQYLGVAHGYEIESFFGIPFLLPTNYSDTDRAVSKVTMEYLANFVNTGNPNTGSKSVGFQWPKFRSTVENYLVMDEQVTSDIGLRYKECAYWSNMVPKLKLLEKVAAEGQISSACDSAPIVALIVLLCAVLIWNGSVLSC